MRGQSSRNPSGNPKTPISVLTGLRTTAVFLFMLSGVLSVLALTGAFYMLQIYDRALTSQSVPTL
ncbi:MAG TPA: type I secretion system permease/ATPase, partial [Hyphomicrobiaceae bacterium]|nr:type I secretion system permease/ATPase [Hyphomicrobiaceae bacterium]